MYWHYEKVHKFLLLQFHVANGDDLEKPAYTTLLNTLATKMGDNDLKEKLQPLFAILLSHSAESIQYTLQTNDLFNIDDELKSFPKSSKTEKVRDILGMTFKSINAKHKMIGNIYVAIGNEMLSEPKIGDLEGFIDAHDKFEKYPLKKLKKHKKTIEDSLDNMRTKYKMFYDNLVAKLILKKEYAIQVGLLRRTFTEFKQIKLDHITGQKKYDGRKDILLFSALTNCISKLEEVQNAFHNALLNVKTILHQYNVQRVLWAELIMNTSFYSSPVKRSCF